MAVAHFAMAFPVPDGPRPVVELYNTQSGHYFMTQFADEAAAVESGAAGPGWVRTGWTFGTFAREARFCQGGYCGTPVSRFYAPGPHSHFFTIDPAEAEVLKQPGSGWNFEGYAFNAFAPVDGACPSGEAVYRLYNNRFAFNDSNHRFVTSQDERVRMLAKGWVDEGVKFCVTGGAEAGPIKSFVFNAPLWQGRIEPSAACEDESRSLGACMAVNNVPAPTTPAPLSSPGASQVYANVTGLSAGLVFIASPLPDAAAAAQVFVQQLSDVSYGIHVDTMARGPSSLTSVNPLYQFKSTVEPGTPDRRVFPFSHAYETDAQISVKFVANVRTVKVRSAGGAAYGHPTLEFIDAKSGHHLYFTVQVYGTVANADFVMPDGTGKIIVSTTFRGDSPFVRNLGSWTFATPSGFVPENPWGKGGPFEFRMDRTEFARVLAAARGGDPALSPAPEDYLLDNFHFNNEVSGDGEIGMNLSAFRLELLRR
jgi:hypothetical protein